MPLPVRRLLVPFGVLLGALALRAMAGVGFANYDTLYALVWGQQLGGGHTPQYAIPVAPTPHPLVEALGLLLSPLGGAGMERVTVGLGFLALAGCGWVVYRLGALWFGRAAGALAAVLLLTRVPVLSYGVRAYVDLPYLLLVLSALLVACTPHNGGRARTGREDAAEQAGHTGAQRPATVLILLAFAGLLRPEAWAFSGLYWLYLALGGSRLLAGEPSHPAPAGEPSLPAPAGKPSLPASNPAASHPRTKVPPRQLLPLALLAASAPLLWMVSDLLVTGDALWSLSNTRHTAEQLARATGIGKVPQYIPRRIGEILRPLVLVAAAVGGVLGLLWLRARVLVGAAAGLVAVGVFAVFAAVGLPINTRYAFLAAAVLCVFAGGGACGWVALPRENPRRRWWAIGGGAIVVALLLSAPGQYRAADRELSNLRHQETVQDDLVALVRRGTISLRCGGLVGVPNHRPIPLLALRLDASPARVVSAQVRHITRGVYVNSASEEVERDYTLDPHDPHPLTATVPPGFVPAGGDRSWQVFKRCL